MKFVSIDRNQYNAIEIIRENNLLYFIATLLIFGSMEVVSKPLMGVVDPFTLTLWRFVLGLIFLLLVPGTFKRFKEIRALSLKSYYSLALLGFLNVFFSMSMLQLAVKYSSAATAATIFCSNPIFVFLLALSVGSEKFSKRKAIGLVLGVVGIFLIMNEKGIIYKSGMLFAVLGALSFSVYTVLSKKVVAGITPVTVNIVSFGFGIMINVLFIGLTGREFMPSTGILSSTTHLLAILYLGIVVSGLGYVTFFNTIKKYTAVSASLIFMLKPVAAIILAFLFLKEDFPEIFFFGFILITGGSFLIISSKLKKIKV